MRLLATICLAIALTGCAEEMEGFFKSVEARDDAKCRELGFEPGTEAYGNCRLQLEQIHAIERAAQKSRRTAQPIQGNSQGMSFMCKDAISRGDSSATFIYC